MATLITSTSERKSPVIDLLNELIELEAKATDTYEAAITELDEDEDRAHFDEALEAHRHHAEELRHVVSLLGGAPTSAHEHPLSVGKVIVGAMVGEPGVVAAVKTHEDDLHSAYLRASSDRALPPLAKALIANLLKDERRERGWLERRLGVENVGEATLGQRSSEA